MGPYCRRRTVESTAIRYTALFSLLSRSRVSSFESSPAVKSFSVAEEGGGEGRGESYREIESPCKRKVQMAPVISSEYEISWIRWVNDREGTSPRQFFS